MYTVKFYTGYQVQRQRDANTDGAICYVEHHFNSFSDPKAGYTVVIVATNASRKSREWGKLYAKLVSEEFGTKIGGDGGIKVGGFGGRGNYLLYYTAMPAILVEPLFASNPYHAVIIKSEDGREKLARVLVRSIREMFPRGGLVAFSVGHKYNSRNPKDRGARVYSGGNEADYAEMVLNKAASLLVDEE
ncbi:MAG TPA: N-acetylmuramoyl-L-alanine amidase [Firmicutes bacterium]|nr:N-acetylmuramoyl-L-alanine amidase [Bacillota bacterium]